MSLASLNQQFGLSDKLQFIEYKDGFPIADISTELCQAKIALQGAQVFEWTPANAAPLIWVSDAAQFSLGKALRGGIPICWPWFGAHPYDDALPAHGFVRTSMWTVTSSALLDDGRIQLAFEYLNSVEENRDWPYAVRLQLTLLIGQSLDLQLTTHNLDTQSIEISEALHTYFHIGDIKQTHVTGLENTDYLDKPDNFARKTQQGPITFSTETDRIYVDTANDCVIHDIPAQRQIIIRKQGSQSTVVWNPWQEKSAGMSDMKEDSYLSMLCVETANAADNTITIAPNGQHHLLVNYRLA